MNEDSPGILPALTSGNRNATETSLIENLQHENNYSIRHFYGLWRKSTNVGDLLKDPKVEQEIEKESNEVLKQTFRLVFKAGKRMFAIFMLWKQLDDRRDKMYARPEEKEIHAKRFLDQKAESRLFNKDVYKDVRRLEKTKWKKGKFIADYMIPFNLTLIQAMLQTIDEVEEKMQKLLELSDDQFADYVQEKISVKKWIKAA